MELKLFNSLRGFDGDYVAAVQRAVADGYDGIEGQAPADPAVRAAFAEALHAHGLLYIQEITTGGGYVPERNAGVEDHLQSLKEHLQRGAELKPLLVSSVAGCDAWPEEWSVRFFWDGLELAEKYSVPLSYATHRSRTLFNPWITQRIAHIMPNIRFTANFSHWCVVCERLLDSELDVIEMIAPQVQHIHACVGYEQGPQVPHPAAPEYAAALASHQRCWDIIWRVQAERGLAISTMTPAFGPDGYLHTLPFTNTPVADLRQINRWMCDTERQHFLRHQAHA